MKIDTFGLVWLIFCAGVFYFMSRKFNKKKR